MLPIDYIVHETERQSGTIREGVGMHDAWLAATYSSILEEVVSEDMLLSWVRSINGVEGYRNTPVYFRSGGHAVNHASIPRLMAGLVEAINDQSIGLGVDHFTREFLEIHPFTDGNGRVGSLLWNYLNGTILDPEPMPYFFGEA